MDNDESTERSEPEALPEDVPVTMPELPLSLDVDTPQQMKALADPVRHRILGIIQSQTGDGQADCGPAQDAARHDRPPFTGA